MGDLFDDILEVMASMNEHDIHAILPSEFTLDPPEGGKPILVWNPKSDHFFWVSEESLKPYDVDGNPVQAMTEYPLLLNSLEAATNTYVAGKLAAAKFHNEQLWENFGEEWSFCVALGRVQIPPSFLKQFLEDLYQEPPVTNIRRSVSISGEATWFEEFEESWDKLKWEYKNFRKTLMGYLPDQILVFGNLA